MVKQLVAQFHTRDAAEEFRVLLNEPDKFVVLQAYDHPWSDSWMVFKVEQ